MTASSVTSPAARAVPDVLALYWPPFFLKRSLRNEPVNRHPGGPTWQHKETEMRCEWGKRKRQRRQTGGEDEQRRCEHCPPPHPPQDGKVSSFPQVIISLSLSDPPLASGALISTHLQGSKMLFVGHPQFMRVEHYGLPLGPNWAGNPIPRASASMRSGARFLTGLHVGGLHQRFFILQGRAYPQRRDTGRQVTW